VHRREGALARVNSPVRVQAAIQGSNDAVLNIRYVNHSNPSESQLLASNVTVFDRFMLFDEPDIHELIFLAMRGDQQAGAALQVVLTDQVAGQVIFPEANDQPLTPFDGRAASLDLGVVSR
jgi:hypothetical protein